MASPVPPRLRSTVFGVAALLACVAPGILRAADPVMPLWAYGVTTPPKPGDKAVPQGLPSRNLRPNQDATEQTRLRTVAGSEARYSLVDIRDLSNVVDWFPGDHPAMTPIMKHGPPGPDRRPAAAPPATCRTAAVGPRTRRSPLCP